MTRRDVFARTPPSPMIALAGCLLILLLVHVASMASLHHAPAVAPPPAVMAAHAPAAGVGAQLQGRPATGCPVSVVDQLLRPLLAAALGLLLRLLAGMPAGRLLAATPAATGQPLYLRYRQLLR